MTNSSKDKRLDLLKSSQVLSVFVTESVVRAVILKTTFVHCTTTLTHQQILRMRSTDWLSHHRLAIYRYEYVGTNVYGATSERKRKHKSLKTTL